VVNTLGTDRHKALIALLIKERVATGLTQVELATRLGQYQSFVARLESGQRRVDVVEFMKLAEILGFDASSAIKRLSEVAG
jgi:transcriptional regulator with XRE-family HTH domain